MTILVEFSIIEDLNSFQKKQLIDLFHEIKWNRTEDEMEVIFKNSISFGLIENKTQKLVGYARIITDQIKYAYCLDLIVSPQYQKHGLGGMLIKSIISNDKLKNIKYFEMTCSENMISFYKKFGFSEDYFSLEFGRIQPMRLCRNISV